MAEARHESAFRSAILDPAVPTPDGLASAFGGVPDKRFDVYRNNVTVSLTKALAEIFPAVSRIVGERRFAELARIFVRARPPKSPLVFRYGDEFPDFIADFTPAASMPYLADVARIERAWLDAYHAADASPLAPEALASIAPDDLSNARFATHPAAALIRSRFAAMTIFNANRQGRAGRRINAGIAEICLITRPDTEIFVSAIAADDAAFVAALMDRHTLAEAANAGAAANAAFDLSAALGRILATGVFTALEA